MPTKEDEELIELVELHNEDAAEIMERLADAAGTISFPITDVKELMDALGGPSAKVEIGGQQVPVGSIAGRFPKYYFPIADESEMIAKLADATLRKPGRGSGPADAAQLKLMDAKANNPNKPRPNVPDKEVRDEMMKNPGLRVGGRK